MPLLPLEGEARIILTATPRFAIQIGHKYGEGPADRVVCGVTGNHSRLVITSFVQNTVQAVAAVVRVKEEQRYYATPELQEPVTTIDVGVDEICMVMVDDGKRQAMVGRIIVNDKKGERQHTTYVFAASEYGKEKFYQRMAREIESIQRLTPPGAAADDTDTAGGRRR